MRGVSAATWKRLEQLEQTKTAVKHVGGWPPIMYDIDEWTALAAPEQEALLLSTLDREPEPVSAPVRDPMDVTYKYKPDPAHVKPRRVES